MIRFPLDTFIPLLKILPITSLSPPSFTVEIKKSTVLYSGGFHFIVSFQVNLLVFIGMLEYNGVNIKVVIAKQTPTSDSDVLVGKLYFIKVKEPVAIEFAKLPLSCQTGPKG